MICRRPPMYTTEQLVTRLHLRRLRAMETDLILSDLLCVLSDPDNMILVWPEMSISCFRVLISKSRSLLMLTSKHHLHSSLLIKFFIKFCFPAVGSLNSDRGFAALDSMSTCAFPLAAVFPLGEEWSSVCCGKQQSLLLVVRTETRTTICHFLDTSY